MIRRLLGFRGQKRAGSNTQWPWEAGCDCHRHGNGSMSHNDAMRERHVPDSYRREELGHDDKGHGLSEG